MHPLLAKSAVTPAVPVPLVAHDRHRYAMPLLLAYPLLAIVGAVTHRQVFSVLALGLLITVLMLPRLLRLHVASWLIWLAALLALGLLWIYGFAGVALETVPVLVNGLLAWWFGRSLVGAEPLVARFVVAIEGAERLQQPGVATYARQLTWFWALLLGAQALWLTVLLLLADHSGLLARFGFVPPFTVSERLAAAWLHVGCYILIGMVFVLEYLYRRWRLRHLVHLGWRDMALAMARQWPRVLRGGGTTP